MKKIISLTLLLSVVLSLASCSSSGSGSASEMARILNPLEYTIYTNVFYENNASGYVDKNYTKDGIFTEIQDSYNSRTRYYVWGYSDETLCCDWQWEFVPKEGEELPKIGSHVKVNGDFVKNSAALDGYWLESATVETVSEYKAAIGKFDTTTMSPTLARVQLINMRNFAEEHNGETIMIYGRVASDNMLQHPYYNGSWTITLEYDKQLPAIGTYVTVTGKFTGTSLLETKIVVEDLKVGEQ